jgi:hypothetical protein
LTYFTQKQLGSYILGAFFAGVVFVLSYYFLGINTVIVGASANYDYIGCELQHINA